MGKTNKNITFSTDTPDSTTTQRHLLIHSLFEEYITMYAARDEKLTSFFSENFSGYAGSSDLLITDKSEWIRITRQDFAQIPDKIDIEMIDLSLQDLTEHVVVATAFFRIHLPPPKDFLSNKTARLVLIFRLEQTTWKIVHSGISIPFGLAHNDEVYPISQLEKRNRQLEHIINVRTKELREANKLLQKQSNTDGLTNLSNRRHFDYMLNQEWNRCQRNGTSLAVIMTDVDNFKGFNDLYGHLAGDECLQEIAQVLTQSARRVGDIVARYGGEEFVILLPNINLDIALERAQNIQKMLLHLAIPNVQSSFGIVTISFGIASLQPSSQQKPTDIVRLADIALYRAKLAGRNCIQLDSSTSS